MKNRYTGALLASLLGLLLIPHTFAAEHIINAEARRFNPDIVYIQPGDTVGFINMTSHNSVSEDALLPEGAEPWRSELGANLKLTLEIEGVYPYVCEPHIGFGMVGVIVVGEPVNVDEAMAKAREILEGPKRRLIGKILKVQRAAAAAKK
ncbi:MAG: plastocyanin/azurin family copper-binding protein [Gammaproteobacteria bacterium]